MTDAAEATGERLIGQVLANRYQIEEKLGEGAMGAVYRARHVKVGRPFAVKVLHPRLLEDHKTAQRFEREAELAGRLRHPNVIGVVDVGETPDGLRYMVMDFAHGGDLAAALSEAPFPPARIIHLVRQLLEGLYHAHEAGLIHRDFKPENVIVEKDDHGSEIPRIVDFGIALLREGGESTSAAGRLTTNGLVLGTPHYMAPEQAVADPIDHRIDLFALGIVIYEMLCGRLPFDGNGAEVARANLLLDPPPISERVPYLEVDPLLEAFARRLLAKKRDQRPATAKAARELLDLIERDRAAASAALGIPVADALRTPQVTADVAPQRAAVHEDSGAYPPAAAPSMRASDLEAPPVPQGEASIETAPSQPLAWTESGAPRSRRRWIIAALAAAVAAAAIAVVATRGGGDTPTPPAEPTVATVEPKAPLEPSAPAPVATPAATPGSAMATPPPAPTAGSAVATPPPTATTGSAEPTEPDEKPPTSTRPARPTPHETKTPTSKPRITTPTPKTAPKAEPEVKPDPPSPTVAKPEKDPLADEYIAVGRDLRLLGDKASDLWKDYRSVSLGDAQLHADKRAALLGILADLRKKIAARK